MTFYHGPPESVRSQPVKRPQKLLGQAVQRRAKRLGPDSLNQPLRSSRLLSLCTRYIARLPTPAVETDQDLGRLSAGERGFLRGLRWRTSITAFTISVVCALGFFLPAYVGWYPEARVLVFGYPFQFPWAFWLAMAVWLVIEIGLLMRLNLRSVQQAAVGTGFLSAENRSQREPEVVRIALATPARELARFGLDPYQDANPVGLFVFNLLQMTKGLLAHQIARLVLIGIGGRAALRAVLDFSGLPIYGAINVLAVNKILTEAEIIIMGRKAIEEVASSLPNVPGDAAFEDSIYDALQFIAMSKRDFHPNHVALADAVLKHYRIPLRESHRFTEDSVTRVKRLPPEQRKVVSLVVVAGLVLDGRLSARESKRLVRLEGPTLLGVSEAQISKWAARFKSGEGISDLLQHECFAIR